MSSFFEMSFEEFCAKRRYVTGPGYSNDLAREVWNREAAERFAMIKASPHYHDGVPCREFHFEPENLS